MNLFENLQLMKENKECDFDSLYTKATEIFNKYGFESLSYEEALDWYESMINTYEGPNIISKRLDFPSKFVDMKKKIKELINDGFRLNISNNGASFRPLDAPTNDDDIISRGQMLLYYKHIDNYKLTLGAWANMGPSNYHLVLSIQSM